MRTVRLIAALFLALAGLTSAVPVFAQGSAGKPKPTDERIPIVTEVPIPVPSAAITPGSTPERVAQYLTEGRVEDLAQYIGIIYNFLISIVGVVAAVMMIVGGFQYLTSAGDSGRISAAKGRIGNAFIGLVLALGAYTILNTINPKLLSLSLPDTRNVTTELFTLPWCDDLTVPVSPVGSGTSCGFAGMYKQGNSDQYCIYAGSCRARRDSVPVVDTQDGMSDIDSDENDPMFATCVQVADVQPATLKEKLEKDPNTKFAECVYCGDLTHAKARSMGFDVGASCKAWMKAFDSTPARIKDAAANQWSSRSDIKDGFFHVCYPRTGAQGCMGAPVFCFEVTRNEDGSLSDYETNGCEGYDEDPQASFARDLDENGFAKPRYEYNEDGFEEYPVHLGTLCATNPCIDFIDPKTGKQPFVKGCKSGNGIVFAARRIVSHGDIGSVDDCRNQ